MYTTDSPMVPQKRYLILSLFIYPIYVNVYTSEIYITYMYMKEHVIKQMKSFV